MPAMRETWAGSLGWEPTPVFLAAESPWTEEPGGLQSLGSPRVRHDWAQHSMRQDELSEGSQMSYLLLKIFKWPLAARRLGFIYLENKYTLNFKVANLFLCFFVYFCLFWRIMKSSIPSVVSLALFSFAQLVCGMSIHIVACRYNSTMFIADAVLQFSYLCPYYWKVFGLF